MKSTLKEIIQYCKYLKTSLYPYKLYIVPVNKVLIKAFLLKTMNFLG